MTFWISKDKHPLKLGTRHFSVGSIHFSLYRLVSVGYTTPLTYQEGVVYPKLHAVDRCTIALYVSICTFVLLKQVN
jgi:hypothetical protein